MKVLLSLIIFLLAGFSSILASPVLAAWNVWDTPVVYYNFEGTTGSVLIKDLSGNNNLTLAATSGTPTGIKPVGYIGRMAKFNGTTDYGSAIDSAIFSQTGSFSVETWVKFNSISVTANTIQTVLAKWDETTDIRSYRIIIQTDSTGRAFPKFQISTDGTAANIKTATGGTQIIVGKWYLLTGYYNATSPGSIYVYVNGVRDGTTTSVGTSISDTSSGFYLGATKTGASTYANFLNGGLDELRLLSGTRTEGSIAYSMQRGKPVIEMHFDDGSGLQATDRSPQTNRGALVNFPTDNSQWVAGMNNTYGLSFNASDYVDLGNRPTLQLGKAITISAWINPTDLAANYTIVSQPNTNGYTFGITTAGEMTFGALGGSTVTTTGAGITAGSWQYVTISYDGANAAFYVNGRLIGNPALALWSVTSGAVFVGKAGTTPNYFKGKIDELVIYPYDRTAFEVLVDRNQGVAVFGRQQSLQQANTQFACPTGFIPVPGDPLYGTSDFCVMKYNAKCDTNADGNGDTSQDTGYNTWPNSSYPCNTGGRSIVSSAAGYPIAYVAQTDGSGNDANALCTAKGWHLITNNEYMTIARNVEKQGSNWCDANGSNCGFSPGQSGKYLASGHNDNGPACALQASTDDTQACYGTVTKDVNTTCGAAGTQKRTHALSNGETIWDMAGNVWEWTNDTILGKNEPTGSSPGFNWREFTALTTYGTLAYDNVRPSNSSWNSTQLVGQIYSDGTGSNNTAYAFRRGAD